MMKDYGTMWRVVVRGRKPKPGTGPYPYGSVPLKNAQELGIYLYEKQDVKEKKWKSRWDYIKGIKNRTREEEQDKYSKLIHKVEMENYVLENKLATLIGSITRVSKEKESLRKLIDEYSGGNL